MIIVLYRNFRQNSHDRVPVYRRLQLRMNGRS
jgi:hypothetical protein